MRGGGALTDKDREPWLKAVGGWVGEREREGVIGVVTCSALKKRFVFFFFFLVFLSLVGRRVCLLACLFLT